MYRTLITTLLSWYDREGRHDLPWRQTRDPYHILISEIMLQQTQVSRVIEKYHEFLTAFPTLQALAAASPAAVITAWKGLGYNRRALFLQKTAQTVVREHDGVFPQDIDTLKTLPGVGDYTARAILSFAFEVPVPMMDTNHRRFYQRVLFGITTQSDQTLLERADILITSVRRKQRWTVYDWNQALMDFGSRLCTTRKPACDSCPLQRHCAAYPDILSYEPPKKQTSTPFRETDRYIRGRIIDLLRERGTIAVPSLRRHFRDINIGRYRRVVERLEKDQLIRRDHGQISLPT